MSTESPSTIQHTSSLLLRLIKQLMSFLEIEEIASKRDQFLYHSHSPLSQLTLDLQILIKILMKRIQEQEKGFEQQLQKLQQKLRKHAKSQCEMKLFTDYLQDELKTAQAQKTNLQKQKKLLEIHFNKQIETLKTQFSHGNTSKYNEEKCLETARASIKPTDALSKIKLKLLNLGNIDIQQPQSCINTLRKSLPCLPQQLRPLSQPNSNRNSPKNEKAPSKSKSKTKLAPKQQKKSKNNLKLQLKPDQSKLKPEQSKKHSKSKTKLKKN